MKSSLWDERVYKYELGTWLELSTASAHVLFFQWNIFQLFVHIPTGKKLWLPVNLASVNKVPTPESPVMAIFILFPKSTIWEFSYGWLFFCRTSRLSDEEITKPNEASSASSIPEGVNEWMTVGLGTSVIYASMERPARVTFIVNCR